MTPTPTSTSGPSVSPPPLSSPSPAASPGTTVWREVDDPALAEIHQVYGAAWSGDHFVLAGIAGGPTARDGVAFWTSDDGASWAIGEGRTTGWVNDFAFDSSAAGAAIGGSGAAIGFFDTAVTAWASADGIEWTLAPDQSAFVPRSTESSINLLHLARGDAGYVAVGHSMPHPVKTVMLVSPDGVAWTRLPSNPAFSGVNPDDLAGIGDRFVLVGHTRWPYRSLFWTSTDGRAWTELPPPPGVDPTEVARTYQVVAGPAGWLMSRSGPGALTWTSTDGLTWTVGPAVPGSEISHGLPHGLLAIPAGFVAATSPLPTSVWLTRDLMTWESVGQMPGQATRWLAASDDVAVGATIDGDISVAALPD